jgi:hypothetical protein
VPTYSQATKVMRRVRVRGPIAWMAVMRETE